MSRKPVIVKSPLRPALSAANAWNSLGPWENRPKLVVPSFEALRQGNFANQNERLIREATTQIRNSGWVRRLDVPHKFVLYVLREGEWRIVGRPAFMFFVALNWNVVDEAGRFIGLPNERVSNVIQNALHNDPQTPKWK